MNVNARRVRNVRRWLIGSTVALLVCSIAVSLFVIGVSGARNANRAADAMMASIGERTTNLIRSELSGPIAARAQLATIVAGGRLDQATLERLLAADLATLPQLSGAYVGYPDGRFVFVRRAADRLVLKRVEVSPRRVTEATLDHGLVAGPPTEIDDDYNPTKRPWYTSAIAAREAVWTDPYVFHSSQQPGVTSAEAVFGPDGRVVAVVGVDIEVSTLNRFLAGLPIDDRAEAFIIAGDDVIAAPSDYTVIDVSQRDARLLPARRLGLNRQVLDAALLGAVTADGRRSVATTFDDPTMPDWTIAVQTDGIELVDAVRRQTQVALATTGVAAVVLLAGLAFALRRMRQPFRALLADAQLDPLTGLANRRSLHELGASAVRRATRDGADIAVAVLDVDEFKALNDRLGHTAGDRALQRVAAALAEATVPDDIVARFGGDEFVIVLRRRTDTALVAAVDQLHAAVDAALAAERDTAGCHATVGVARQLRRSLSFANLFDEADAALMAAKRSGAKRQIVWADRTVPAGNPTGDPAGDPVGA